MINESYTNVHMNMVILVDYLLFVFCSVSMWLVSNSSTDESIP